jgi:hypothetical protein
MRVASAPILFSLPATRTRPRALCCRGLSVALRAAPGPAHRQWAPSAVFLTKTPPLSAFSLPRPHTINEGLIVWGRGSAACGDSGEEAVGRALGREGREEEGREEEGREEEGLRESLGAGQ